MNINTKNLVSITDANQNFSKVARLVDENGSVIILKNNVPRYLVMEFSSAEEEQLAADPSHRYFCCMNNSLQKPEGHRACAMKECWTLH